MRKDDCDLGGGGVGGGGCGGKDFLEHSIIFPRMPNHLDFLGVSQIAWMNLPVSWVAL